MQGPTAKKSAHFLALILTLLVGVVVPGTAYAVPASPEMVEAVQPDGSRFKARIMGDEYQGWAETGDGFTVVRDKSTKFWEYAAEGKGGSLEPSGVKVGKGRQAPEDTPRHLKPRRDTAREAGFSALLLKNKDKAKDKSDKDNKAGKTGGGASASEPGTLAPVMSAGATSQGSLFASDPSGYWYPYPVSGTRNVLVILVGFADRPLVTTPEGWYKKTFTTEPGARSVANFYKDNSFGALTVNPVSHTEAGNPLGVVSVTLSSNHPNYGGDITYPAETAWLNEALAQAAAYVDFPTLDTDSNGTFDNSELIVYLVPAGYEAAGSIKTPSIWAHSWGGPGVSAGGVGIEIWAMNGELNDAGLQHPIGAMTHELGHSMCGLPDLYDTSYANKGLGGYSLMAAGSWGKSATDVSAAATPVSLDAWSRQYAGWATPREPVSGTVGFAPALSAPDAPVKLVAPAVSTTEYFLAENRYPEGWDLGMEQWLGQDWGGGLLVIHVDITAGTATNDGTPGNNDINRYVAGGHQGVMAVEASTAYGTLKNNSSYGHLTHLFFDGNNANFAPGALPGSGLYDGTPTGLALYSVSKRGRDMTASLEPSASLPVSAITSPTAGAYLGGTAYTVTGAAADRSGTGLLKVEVSTNGGVSWYAATDTSGNGTWSSWSYNWTLPADGAVTVISRAKDNSGGVEAPASVVPVTVDNNPPTVTASLPGGTYLLKQWASLTASKPSTIYYTTDGTEPTTSSPVYAGPLPISATAALKFFGVTGGGNAGTVTTVDYKVDEVAAWTRQPGTPELDTLLDAVTDAPGNVYLAGITYGSLDGHTNAGDQDVMVVKMDPGGNTLWTAQIGTAQYDYASRIAVGADGSVYVAGNTDGAMPGCVNSGLDDLFLAKLDGTDGGHLWVKQMGSTDSDLIYGCGVDGSGDVYVGGYTWGDFDGHTSAGMSDIIVVKFDPDGNKVWSVQRGNEYDSWANNMDVDAAGDVYIGGDTWGGLDGNTSQSGHYDAFLMKLDTTGAWQWTKQFGDGFWTTVNTIAHDGAGNVFATGFTGGSIVDGYVNKGSNDYFVIAYDTGGTELWRREGGTSQYESPYGICADTYGNVYVSGGSAGRLGSDTVTGNADAYLIKYRNDGTFLWTRQFGTPQADFGNAVTADAAGGLYLCGETHAGMDGNTYSGGTDPFVMKLDIGQPFSAVTWPSDGAAVNAPSCTITGYADDRTGTGVTLVEVSTDGGATWQPAAGTSEWNYGWTIPSPGVFTIMTRATDSLGNVEIPGQGITVTVGNNTLDSAIASPLDGSSFTASPVEVTGTASGSGITQVEISTDGGATWAAVSDTSGDGSWSKWSCSWAVPADGTYTISSRAVSGTDQEYPSGSISVSVDWVTPATTATPPAGTYQSRQRVTLTASEPSDIRYTTDGTEPDMSLPVYASPLLLSSDAVLKYFATDPAGHSETVKTSGYIINPAALWTRQGGSASSDYACAAAADASGNVYITGYTEGSPGGDAGHGGSDVFVSKYDLSGNNLWTHLYGSDDNDIGQGAAADSAGNVYVAGYTYGPFEGNTLIGGGDAFVMKLDPDGNPVWSRQLGSVYSDYGRSVSVDPSGNVFIAGETYGAMGGFANAGYRDVFIAKLDPAGNVVWVEQDGTDQYDSGGYVAVDDDGNTYLAGDTLGTLDGLKTSGSSDLFLQKRGPDGSLLWSAQTGSGQADLAESLAVDGSGAAYAAGVTYGAMHGNTNNGGADGYLTKFGPDGARLWTKLLGSPLNDYVYAVTAGGATVSIAGLTYGGLGGVTNAGSSDSFVARYRSDGSLIGTVQSGTPDYDIAYAAASSGGDVYAAGYTQGWLDGNTYSGSKDFFVMKIGSPGLISCIAYPSDGGAVRGAPVSVAGTSEESGGPGISSVDVSTDGGTTWSPATDTSDDGSWSSWSYSWTPPTDGSYVLVSKATDLALAEETPGPGITVTVDNIPPTVSIYNPNNGATITGLTYAVSVTADGTGTGISSVEVSTDGGATWNGAYTLTGNWYYEWTPPISGVFQLLCRATDNAGNTSVPGTAVNVTVVRYGTPELPHYYWGGGISGTGCGVCHTAPVTFGQPDHREGAGFCASCHNTAGTAHGRLSTSGRQHSVMASITSAGLKTPTYGNITSGEYNNIPGSRLAGGDKVVCVTCHNTMQKSEDYGRTWETTTTSDRRVYTMQYGGWTARGHMVPHVYRDTSLWSGPSNVKERKGYLASPSEYTYDETTGKFTFRDTQPSTVYIYVTLDYPYLRAGSEGDRLCTDCHTQATHKGINCMTCHASHNTANTAGIREVVRTPDRLDMPVRFERYTGAGSFADGDATYDGICEVCHTATRYYLRDGTGFSNHSGGTVHDGSDCTACHSHATGFAK